MKDNPVSPKHGKSFTPSASAAPGRKESRPPATTHGQITPLQWLSNEGYRLGSCEVDGAGGVHIPAARGGIQVFFGRETPACGMGACPDAPGGTRSVDVPEDPERTLPFKGNVIIFLLHVIAYLSVRDGKSWAFPDPNF